MEEFLSADKYEKTSENGGTQLEVKTSELETDLSQGTTLEACSLPTDSTLSPQDGTSTPELNFQRSPDSPFLLEKAIEIEAVLSSQRIPTEQLKQFAITEGGLVNDKIRKRGWPALLGLDINSGDPMPDEETLRTHPEFTQVVLDVNRSLKRFPPGIPYEKRVALQDQLTNLILRVITKYPHLSYYQGYHDVAVTFLLVVGEELAFRIMERLSTDHLRDCMEATMDKTSHLLNFIFPLIDRLHPQLCAYIEKSRVGTMFCLPWFLTWYGHNLNHYKDVVRLYDLFLATPPMMPIYLAAAIVVQRQDEIFNTECDLASIHCLLSQIPDDLPFQNLIDVSLDLYDKFPPESLETEVVQRTQREIQSRKAEEAQARARLAKSRSREARTWVSRFVLDRYSPPSRTHLFILAVSVALGLFAYFRAEAGSAMSSR